MGSWNIVGHMVPGPQVDHFPFDIVSMDTVIDATTRATDIRLANG
jgi:hypothetical protein